MVEAWKDGYINPQIIPLKKIHVQSHVGILVVFPLEAKESLTGQNAKAQVTEQNN